MWYKTLHRFRALFPNWKFFEEVGDELVLEARLKMVGQGWSAWARVRPLRSGHWMELFHNPLGLLDWYIFSLLQEIGSRFSEGEELNERTAPVEILRKILEEVWLPIQLQNSIVGKSLFSKGRVCRTDLVPELLQFRIRWRPYLNPSASELEEGLQLHSTELEEGRDLIFQSIPWELPRFHLESSR